MPTYHVGTNLRTGTKHEFTLSVGIVDLTREEVGQLICSSNWLIQEAFPIAGARRQEECMHSEWKKKSSKMKTNQQGKSKAEVGACVISFTKANISVSLSLIIFRHIYPSGWSV